MSTLLKGYKVKKSIVIKRLKETLKTLDEAASLLEEDDVNEELDDFEDEDDDFEDEEDEDLEENKPLYLIESVSEDLRELVEELS